MQTTEQIAITLSTIDWSSIMDVKSTFPPRLSLNCAPVRETREATFASHVSERLRAY